MDLPVSNPYLTDKIIDEEMTPLLNTSINDKRKWLESFDRLGKRSDVFIDDIFKL